MLRAGEETRTLDLLLGKQLLYQLSYTRIQGYLLWSADRYSSFPKEAARQQSGRFLSTSTGHSKDPCAPTGEPPLVNAALRFNIRGTASNVNAPLNTGHEMAQATQSATTGRSTTQPLPDRLLGYRDRHPPSGTRSLRLGKSPASTSCPLDESGSSGR